MYELKKRKEFGYAKVRDLIAALLLYEDADIVCDGDEFFWLHVAEDGSLVNIDSNSLDDAYEGADNGT